MDLIDFMQPIAILTCAIIGYILYFQSTTRKKNGHYSIPNWNFFLKKIWATRQIRNQKKNYAEKMKDFEWYKCEEPKKLYTEDSYDKQLFYGSDSDGNYMLINLTRRRHKVAEVWLILYLRKQNKIYTLPDHPITRMSVINATKFEAGNLTIECLIAYSKWRITYNGKLRGRIRNECSTDFKDDELKYVKFNFIWTCASNPLHYPMDWSDKLMANGLATEQWRDGKWSTQLLKPEFSGYDQFGSLFGQVFEENEDCNDDGIYKLQETVLNLPGLRQRRWNHLREDVHRSVTLFGVCNDGNVYIIGATSFRKNLTHVEFGFIRCSNGKIIPIDWTDFHLVHFAEDPTQVTRAITIRFTANGRNYSTTIHFQPKNCVQLHDESSTNYLTQIIPSELGLNGERGHGIGILINLLNNDRDLERLPSTPSSSSNRKTRRLRTNESVPDYENFAYSFKDFEAHSNLTCGGKGSSLAMLTSSMELFKDSIFTSERQDLKPHQFIVPAGFILSVSSYKLQIEKNPNLQRTIETLIKYKPIGIDEKIIEDLCMKITEEFLITNVHPEVLEAITDIYIELRKKYEEKFQMVDEDDVPFKLAVRSSAIGEDSNDASYAGQNATFLGLKDLPEVISAVKHCWASLYTFQSVQYRRQHIQPIDSQMAVVIQMMVPSDCAGVLFTNHPTSGDPSKILITANFGLGESVVSGSVDPDVYIVNRDYADVHLTIKSIKLGSKEHFVRMSDSASENIIQEKSSEEKQHTACLSEEIILKLSEISIGLEKLYGNTRDIEWAVYKNKIYLLQARPITSVNSLSDWELLHELDSAVMSTDDLVTSANIGEVLPQIICPLTVSTVAWNLGESITKGITKDNATNTYSMALKCSHFRAFLDIYSIFFNVVAKEDDFNSKIQSIAVFGHEFITPKIYSTAVKRNGVATFRKKLGVYMDMAKSIWTNKAESNRLEKFVKGFKNQYASNNLLHFKTAEELYNDLQKNLVHLDYTTLKHSNTSKVSIFFQIILMAIMAEGKTELTSDHYADMALILGSCKDIESSEVPTLLLKICTNLHIHDKLNEFKTIDPVNGVNWLISNCPEAYILFQEFLNNHGHRCLQEFDLESETWEMRPYHVIEMLQTSAINYENITKNQNVKLNLSDSEIVSMLKTPKKNSTRKIVSKLISLCRKSVQLREKSKSHLITYTNEIRKGFIRLSELMVQEGLLPNKKLIFYLRNDEISIILKTRNAHLVNKAMRLMKLFPKWTQFNFDEMNFGIVKPVNLISETQLQLNSNSIYVIGTPVSEGIISGRACVLKSFTEIAKIQSGDILITHSTDIGWSPYFPILSGVVTELGGIISHGAVVAREYGLPCVVGAIGATDKIKHGDSITLNATKGIIIKNI